MSTRCQIRIISGGRMVNLYRHCDGYFEGSGMDLQRALEAGETVFGCMAEMFSGDEYEIQNAPSGDIEFFYLLDFDSNRFEGWAVRLDCWHGVDFHDISQLPEIYNGVRVDLKGDILRQIEKLEELRK